MVVLIDRVDVIVTRFVDVDFINESLSQLAVCETTKNIDWCDSCRES